MADQVAEYREKFLETLAEADDEVMEKYLEGETFTVEELEAAIRRATLADKLNPVLCGTAFKNKGVQPLLDAVVDYVGGDDWVASLAYLKDATRVASVADAEVKEKGGRYIFVRPNPEDLLALTELVEAGSVKPVLAATFPLEDAADAFRSSMDGHVRGKIAVTVGDEG